MVYTARISRPFFRLSFIYFYNTPFFPVLFFFNSSIKTVPCSRAPSLGLQHQGQYQSRSFFLSLSPFFLSVPWNLISPSFFFLYIYYLLYTFCPPPSLPTYLPIGFRDLIENFDRIRFTAINRLIYKGGIIPRIVLRAMCWKNFNDTEVLFARFFFVLFIFNEEQKKNRSRASKFVLFFFLLFLSCVRIYLIYIRAAVFFFI